MRAPSHAAIALHSALRRLRSRLPPSAAVRIGDLLVAGANARPVSLDILMVRSTESLELLPHDYQIWVLCALRIHFIRLDKPPPEFRLLGEPIPRVIAFLLV